MTRPRFLRALWRRASTPDRVATALILLFIAVSVAQGFGWSPEPGVASAIVELLTALFFVSIIFLLFRSRRWVGARLLWKLRNRLILAYIFIAVVPVVLLLAMGGILGYMADVEVAAHLLHDDVHDRMQQVSAASHEALSLARVIANPGTPLKALDNSAPIKALVKSDEQRMPGLIIQFLAAKPSTPALRSSTGPALLFEREKKLWIEGATIGQLPGGRWVEARARLPLTPQFMDALAPELGQIKMGGPVGVVAGKSGSEGLGDIFGPSVSTLHRVLPPPKNLLDFGIVGATTFDAMRVSHQGAKLEPVSLFATFSFRSSSMSQRIEGSLGEFESTFVVLLILVAGLFIVLWLLAFIAGTVLTRTITRTVAKLDEATHHVKAGDFSHRISIVRRDQLGALAESFNSMTASMENLLEEQRQRQRLENELAIAREVQSELFPRSLPTMQGLELGAVCRAARMVSGDYYDCLQLDEHRVAIALADISGKGISAALLMASLNAALRSLVLSGSTHDFDTAKLAERLNRHLLLNTSDDRYATFFFSTYDSRTRKLDYTNAGHLPPFLINGDRVQKLERGGPVIGLLEGCSYEQASIEIEPGSLLAAYSDGMTEPENAYGEEFGPERLQEEILHRRNDPPSQLCDRLIDAVKNWCAPAEPFDDQTILIARME